MKEGIRLYMISGFLGAGKTTLLKNLLSEEKGMENTSFSGKKPVIGVIVNEFGPVGIDAERISDGKLISDDLKIVEISNGSIFCTCLKAGFMRTLIEFSKQPIDILFIENSGMANTVDFHKMLEQISDKTEKKYEYKGSVCVIDAERFLKQVQILTAVGNQVRTADIILINKSDKADREKIEKIKHEIGKLNGAATVYQTTFCKIPADIITEGIEDHGEDGDNKGYRNSNMRSYCIEFARCLDSKLLMKLLEAFSEEMIRIKGNVMTNEGMVQVDAVYSSVSVKHAGGSSEEGNSSDERSSKSKLVLIAQDGADRTAYIKEKWSAIAGFCPELIN